MIYRRECFWIFYDLFCRDDVSDMGVTDVLRGLDVVDDGTNIRIISFM